MAILAPQTMLTARTALLASPSLDVVSASEPPDGSTVVPGIPDAQFSIFGDILRAGLDLFTGGDGLQPPPPPTGFPPAPTGDPLGFAGDCPGLTNVKLPDGSCFDPFNVLPGGDPVISEQVPVNGVGLPSAAGQPVNGRFGVGVFPRVEALRIRRCPKGMALGKDGVCYDGLGRNSPKREWPMGMKPLLTPGERNAIRIAGVAAGKLARSQKSLKKTAKALEKVC